MSKQTWIMLFVKGTDWKKHISAHISFIEQGNLSELRFNVLQRVLTRNYRYKVFAISELLASASVQEGIRPKMGTKQETQVFSCYRSKQNPLFCKGKELKDCRIYLWQFSISYIYLCQWPMDMNGAVGLRLGAPVAADRLSVLWWRSHFWPLFAQPSLLKQINKYFYFGHKQ